MEDDLNFFCLQKRRFLVFESILRDFRDRKRTSSSQTEQTSEQIKPNRREQVEASQSKRANRRDQTEVLKPTEAINRTAAMDATKFDQLPDLCLRKIFALLGPLDLVKCRAVSRQFKFYADRTKVTELVVMEDKSLYVPENWFRMDIQIDRKNSISLNAFNSAKSSPFKLDEQLKFLYLNLLNNDSTYEIVNDLKQLQHLEIYGGHYWPRDRPTKTKSLVLPNLKVLVIRDPHSFVLKTPNLEVLSCRSMDKVRFEYPETIRRVECVNDGESYGELAKLRDLEVLHVELDLDGVLDGIRLSDFTRLKELCFAINFGTMCVDESDKQYRSSVINILHERIALKRDELKLYVSDVPLVNAKQLPVYEVLFPSEISDADFDAMEAERGFKFMNYRLLRRASYPEITWMNFNQLMRLDFEISEDFFERFPRIQELGATGQIEREQFEWFLQNATALRKLELYETRLDQAFIDCLPNLCPRLTHLKFYENSGLVNININIQFLLQFEHLEVFETDRPLHSFDVAAAAFRPSTKLKRLLCQIGNELVEIQRSSAFEDRYSLRFSVILRENGTIKTSQTFFRENLSWAQLEEHYHSRAVFFNAPENRLRIKRARLE